MPNVGMCGDCIDRGHAEAEVQRLKRLGYKQESIIILLVDTHYGFCTCKCHRESSWDKEHRRVVLR